MTTTMNTLLQNQMMTSPFILGNIFTNINKLCSDNLFNGSQFTHIEFKDNEVHLYYLYDERWVIKTFGLEDWKILLKNSYEQVDYKLNINPMNSSGVNDENMFYYIGEFRDVKKFIESYMSFIKKQNDVKKEQNKNDLIIEIGTKKNKNKINEYILILNQMVKRYLHMIQSC